MPRKVDYTALLYPVSRADVSAYRKDLRENRTSQWYALVMPHVATVLVVGLVIIVAVVILVNSGGVLLAGLTQSPSFASLILLGGGLVLVSLVTWVLRLRSRGKPWETMLRLTRFAAANQLDYRPTAGDPKYPGSIFGRGDNRKVSNQLRANSGRALEIANYSYTTGSGREKSTFSWGYLALRLDRRLPHMVLDAKANNGVLGATNLPASFSKNQVLSLEGDFDRYFTLYCPREYERDALYVFTPDLMALLIDNAAPYDVEIADDWMFVYSAKPFPSRDPALYQRLFHIVDTVGAKTLSQSHRYVDERIGEFAPNLIAPQGQRLRTGASRTAAILTVLAFVAWLFLKYGDILPDFARF